MKVACFVGTRPDIIKMYPIIKEIGRTSHELLLIHTGQHYDSNMSNVFMEYLKIPVPNYFLNVKSSREGLQTAKIIAQSENVLAKEDPSIVLVLGDTNSALGAALASSKLRIPVGHVEAGCRSYDKTMSEEINRVLISHLSTIHFAPTNNCRSNLLSEGIHRSSIHLTGHPIVDVIGIMKNRLSNSKGGITKLKQNQYAFATIHRRENITDVKKLSSILKGLNDISASLPVLFPCHPHTMKQFKKLSLTRYLDGLSVIEPVNYIRCLQLITKARVVITDSGGIQQEAALLHTPSITVRDRTEWIETVKLGVNFVVGVDPARLLSIFNHIMNNGNKLRMRFKKTDVVFGSPGVANRIIKIIETHGPR